MFRMLLIGGFLMTLLQGCAVSSQFHLDHSEKALAENSSVIIGAVDTEMLNGFSLDGRRREVLSGGQSFGLATFAIEVPAGEHEISYIGRYDGRNFTRYPVKRRFETKPGSVVSIGSVIVTELPDGKFVEGWVDNHGDIAKDLSEDAPAWLAERLTKGQYSTVPDGYASRDRIDAIIVNQFRRIIPPTPDVRQGPSLKFSGEALGTVVAYKPQPSGPKPISVVHTDRTTRMMAPCDGLAERLVCVSSESRPDDEYAEKDRELLFIDWNTNEFESRAMPPQTERPRAIILHGDSGIVIVTSEFTVHSSIDNGATWVTAETPVEPGLIQMDPGVTARERDGQLYVLLNGTSSGSVVVDESTGKVSTIAMPENVEDVRSMVVTDDALVLGPEWTLASNSRMFFRPWGTDGWVQREMPQGRCMDAWIADAGKSVEVKCGGTSIQYYRSSDLGKTWRTAE